MTGIVDVLTPVPRLRLTRGSLCRRRGNAAAHLGCPPHGLLDHRLVTAAQKAGAELIRHRVRSLSGTTLDETHTAQVIVGADGPHSVVRRSLGLRPGPMAVAIRGYAPTPADRRGQLGIVFGVAVNRRTPGPSIAGTDSPTSATASSSTPGRRALALHLIEQVEALLPGSTECATDGQWATSFRSRPGDADQRGPVLLAGDAAGLVNPMTGEGIYYAIATGLSAGRAAASSIAAGDPESAGARHALTTKALLGSHLKHIAVAGRLCRSGAVLDAGLRTSADDQDLFDDLVELALANGRMTPRPSAGWPASSWPPDNTDDNPHRRHAHEDRYFLSSASATVGHAAEPGSMTSK